jgi:hypothetical protein
MNQDRNEDESTLGGTPGEGTDAADRAGGRPADDGPRKKHGDALADGSGTRHGVGERDERPEGGGDGDSR